MTKTRFLIPTLIAVAAAIALTTAAAAQAPASGSPAVAAEAAAAGPGVVRAVVFHSAGCPMCAQLIHTDLPAVQERLGASLDVIVLSTDDDYGDIAFDMAVELNARPDQEIGVPMLVIGDQIVTGPGPIRDILPVMVATHLPQGGLDWPAIPGLAEFVAATRGTAPSPEPVTATIMPSDTPAPVPTAEPTPVPSPTPTPPPPPPSIAQRVLGSPIALIIVLIAGGLAAVAGVLAWQRRAG